MVIVPGPATVTGAESGAQVSGLPPVAASNSPRCDTVPMDVVNANVIAERLRCAPVPVKVTRWRA